MAGLHSGQRSTRVAAHRYDGGLSFVTVCTAGRSRLFGRVAGGCAVLSPAGRLASDLWRDAACGQAGVVPDAFVVMPDHVHLLFGIVPAAHRRPEAADFAHDDPRRDESNDESDDGGRRGTACCAPTDRERPGSSPHERPNSPSREHSGSPSRQCPGASVRGGDHRRFGAVIPGTVPALIREYKSAVTRAVRLHLGTANLAVWQRGHHDRIVRSDREADHVRRYIADNPAR